MAAPNEVLRKAVHAGTGAFALLLRDLTATQAAGIATAAILFNRYGLPLLAPRLFRADERRRPWGSGIVLYPIAVLLLILLFHRRLEAVAIGWVVLAAGDGAAGLVGRRHGRRQLPWNRTKTIEGTVAFGMAAALAVFGTLVWMGRLPAAAAWIAVPVALFGAFVESLPWRLDDNLTVPLLSGLFACGLLAIDPSRLADAAPELQRNLVLGLAINGIVSAVALRAGAVDLSGMVGGAAVGTLTFGCTGWGGYAVLLSFFVLGSAATRLGYRRKARLGIAQEKKGARSARHALANCGVAVYLGLLAIGSARGALHLVAFACAYATAAFDTVSSEVGQAYGGRPVLITSLRRVPPGTNGAVSWVGTAAGALAATAVGLVAWAGGLIEPQMLGPVVLAAFLGSTADSFLGATLEARGLMDNDAVNFSNTLVGALAGIAFAALVAAAA
jgi:uncharacterized protein (TIGR00297 family)